MTRAARMLEEAEKRWSRRPDAPPADWLPAAPSWFAEVPRLAPTREGADRLWSAGAPVWGRILMANTDLWEPGVGPSAVEVLWSDDPWVRRFPEALDAPAEAYWTLKSGDTAAAGLRSLLAFAKEEQRHYTRGPFPALLSGARVVLHATMLVYREHLPTRRLVDRCVPLVRAPNGEPAMVQIAPVAYWPPELVQVWEHRAAR